MVAVVVAPDGMAGLARRWGADACEDYGLCATKAVAERMAKAPPLPRAPGSTPNVTGMRSAAPSS